MLITIIRLMISLLLLLYLSSSATGECDSQDVECLKEKLSYEAIQLIHSQIDEDHDGVLELSETNEFLKDELNISDSERRSSDFHRRDSSVSLAEFWGRWKCSEAHNWSESQVLQWLETHVGLGQYSHIFRRLHISGRDIPRLATNVSFKSKVLGIADPIARKRLQIMALDVVLFGSPKRSPLFKDLLVAALLLVALLGVYFSLKQNSKLQRERSVVRQLNEKIEKNLNELECLSVLRKTDSDDNVFLDSSTQLLPLQSLLVRTHEVETQYVSLLRQKNNYQVSSLREQMERLNRKRANSLFSSIKYGYSSPLTEMEDKIIDARKSAEDFDNYFHEFKQRWRTIERLSGASILVDSVREEDSTSRDDLPSRKGGLFRRRRKN